MRVGSLFSGYEGIGLALAAVFGTVDHAFVADVCKHTKTKDGRHVVGHYEPHRAPCSILAHRFPDTPNLGDVTLIDWTPWRGKVDVLTAGFPCTDVSVAGSRAGLRDGTRTGLWSQVVRAIEALSPRLVVLENVPGLFTAPAAGDVEPCPWCVGDDPGGNLRALDAVLADLAAIGFDAEWTTLPASGVGAAHRRERWFCLAWPAAVPDAEREGWGAARDAAPGEEAGGWASAVAGGSGGVAADLTLLPTPAAERGGRNKSASDGASVRWGLDYIDRLLPKPAVNDDTCPMGALLPTPTTRDVKGENQRGDDSCLTGALLPTPRATDGTKGGPNQQPDRWGDYGPAIRRHEQMIGRPAPSPTKPNTKGNPKLSDEFDEWLMGLPAGWITDVPGIGWNEVLKACGNGVLIQQAAAAICWLWQWLPATVRTDLQAVAS